MCEHCKEMTYTDWRVITKEGRTKLHVMCFLCWHETIYFKGNVESCNRYKSNKYPGE